MSLYVVLTSCKVPQEITPVHPVALIGNEELKVCPLCGNGDLAAFAIVGISLALVATQEFVQSCLWSHPVFVGHYVALVVRIHAWE